MIDDVQDPTPRALEVSILIEDVQDPTPKALEVSEEGEEGEAAGVGSPEMTREAANIIK